MDGCSCGTCARWPRSTSVRRREHDRVRKHARPSAQRPTTRRSSGCPAVAGQAHGDPRGHAGADQGAGGGAGNRGGSGSARRPPDRRCATPGASGGWGCRRGGRPASYWDHGAPTPRPTANRLLISRLVGVHRSFPGCEGARQRFTHVAEPFADTFLRGDVTVAYDRVQPRVRLEFPIFSLHPPDRRCATPCARSTRAYAVVRRTRRRGGVVRGPAVPAGAACHAASPVRAAPERRGSGAGGIVSATARPSMSRAPVVIPNFRNTDSRRATTPVARGRQRRVELLVRASDAVKTSY